MKKLGVEIPGHPEPAKRVTQRSLWRAKKYAAWKKLAAALIKSKARGRKLDTPCHFTMRVWGRTMRADVDNYIKAGLDACVLSGVIPDDNCKHVQSAHVYFLLAEKDNEKVIITLESV